VISGMHSGVLVRHSVGAAIAKNKIGTNAAGTVALPSGLFNAWGITVGNANAAVKDNLVIGWSGIGIVMSGANAHDGTVQGNTVRGNGIGIGLYGTPPDAAGSHNRLVPNVISGNTQLGIDLGNDGVTPNDPDDPDTGPNDLQNFPVITSVFTDSSTSSTTVQGTLNSTPNSSFTVDVFYSTVCTTTSRQGVAFAGTGSVSTDDSGDGSFSLVFPTAVPSGTYVTATATDASGSTSEFSDCFQVPVVVP